MVSIPFSSMSYDGPVAGTYTPRGQGLKAMNCYSQLGKRARPLEPGSNEENIYQANLFNGYSLGLLVKNYAGKKYIMVVS